MGKTTVFIALSVVRVLSFPFVVLNQMFKGIFDHDNTLEHPANTDPMVVVRPESYRTLKRRNRMLRKYDHKKDK